MSSSRDRQQMLRFSSSKYLLTIPKGIPAITHPSNHYIWENQRDKPISLSLLAIQIIHTFV
ncbi:hypothetical protein H0A36_18830 [Endozoicomonas sp. SM1973]|uniref:Uncharacterized protein n=1 Tax=Spartinivicinus marinus TaxID=2994442 RepID=A0A853IDF1_9GAMM|nr:hypothetical protein [Spartinivicinus marinus]MCX4029743.1 hypothetical protein [Spartinivicinus marinus]NYZ68074.1 hypothetical protein [Spartinivicinus marinus]